MSSTLSKLTQHASIAANAAETEWRVMHLTEVVALAEEAIERAVADMRGDGCSWAKIGVALGVSKQAAQQRYGRASGDLMVAQRDVADGVGVEQCP